MMILAIFHAKFEATLQTFSGRMGDNLARRGRSGGTARSCRSLDD
jgi:hypothetical protein